MYVENTNTGFAIHDLKPDQLELLQYGLLLLKNDFPRNSEFNVQRHDCNDMYLQIDVELLNSKDYVNSNI